MPKTRKHQIQPAGDAAIAASAKDDGSQPLANIRWEAFCQHYTGDCRRNASASYRAAGYKPVKNRSDTACALKLLANAFIRRRIDYLNAQALEVIRLHARDAQEIMGAIATASYSDFLDEFGRVDIAKVRDPRLAPAVRKCRAIRDMEGNIIDYDLELYDRVKAGLEPLGLTEKPDDAPAQSNQVLVIKI